MGVDTRERLKRAIVVGLGLSEESPDRFDTRVTSLDEKKRFYDTLRTGAVQSITCKRLRATYLVGGIALYKLEVRSGRRELMVVTNTLAVSEGRRELMTITNTNLRPKRAAFPELRGCFPRSGRCTRSRTI